MSKIANHAEFEFGQASLERVGNKVDIVLTHTMPEEAIKEWNVVSRNADRWKNHRDPTATYLSEIFKTVTFIKWFAGHLHTERTFMDKRIKGMYEDIIEV